MTKIATIFFNAGLFLLLTFQAFGQVTICDGKQSSHPVDIKASQLRDSLRHIGVDTIIVYRHWLGTNGFNGYGKVIWLDKGGCFQYKIDFENNGDNYGVKQVSFSKLKTDSLFRFFFDNSIDTVATNPIKQDIMMSHDAEHFVEVAYNDKKYCFIISGLLVQFNPDNLRGKFVRLLAEEKKSTITIEGTRIYPDTKKKKN